ncbi:MAG: hypothetical protein OXG98_00345 [Gemmatimonadetes bacterium]|nr:hypothetical protein [Gemmatimonadota bacterium]
MKWQYADARLAGNGPDAGARVAGEGPKPAHGGPSGAVTQLEGKERSIRVAARGAGVLPFIAMNADAGDPARDTPRPISAGGAGARPRVAGFAGRKRSYRSPQYTKGLPSPEAQGPSAPGREDEEVCT